MGTGLNLKRGLDAAKIGRCPRCRKVTEYTLGRKVVGQGQTKESYITKTCSKCGMVQETYQNTFLA